MSVDRPVPGRQHGALPGPSAWLPTEDERPPHVLVVDDEEINRELVEAILSPHGYRLSMAVNGPDGLRLTREALPDVVLLDVLLPGMDGFAVCRAIKADRATRGIPVVLLTALREVEDRVTGLEAGADDFLSKPFNRHELLARLRSLVKLRRLQEAEWQRFRRSLERYLPPPAVEQVLNEPELASVGRRQTATVLFADLRGFTALVERFEPELVVALLDVYLGSMAEIVLQHEGMVDKFIGDAIMAVFGAPVPRPDDAGRAVQAALAMHAAVAEIQAPGLESTPLLLGVGIHTGEVVAGNIGSDRRVDYTVVGDTVNVAARLEQIAGPGEVLISQSTLEQANDVVDTSDLGTIQIKGRQEGVRVFSARRRPPS